jgi:hypothetical protein
LPASVLTNCVLALRPLSDPVPVADASDDTLYDCVPAAMSKSWVVLPTAIVFVTLNVPVSA